MIARPLIFLALLAISPQASAQDTTKEATSPEAPTHLAADRDSLRRAMLDQRIETGLPRPGMTLYMRDLTIAFNHWMNNLLDRLRPRFARFLGPLTEPLLKLLLALLVGGLVAFAAIYALRSLRGRAELDEPAVRRLEDSEQPPEAPGSHLTDKLRQCLDDGDAAAAIEALWWWLASHLVGDRAEASWTSRELITRAGRRDLTPSVRRLDRMIYGSVRPATGDVRQLWNDLRETVG